MTRPIPEAPSPGDGALELADLSQWLQWFWGWAQWVFFLPGDTALVVVIVEFESVARKFGMTTAWYGGWFSGFVSALAWSILLGIVWMTLRRGSR
ncbi:MAG: hypothetical protein ACI8PT_004937 [Gammaproteobacteria bacterium]|jgi:hypothetical protein